MAEKPHMDQFIEHSQNWIFNFQDNPLLRELLAMRLDEKDAEFLSVLPHFPQTLGDLKARYNMAEDKLMAIMAPLKKSGFIFEVEGRSATRYSLTDPLFFFGRLPGWRGEVDDLNKKYAPLMNDYYNEHFGPDFLSHHTKGLRAIPENGTIADSRTILPYEDLLAYVDQEDYHTVSSCACRHNYNLDPDRADCSHEVGVCLHFGRLGKYIVKYDMGRKIEKQETLEILARCADAGLVHGISNTRHGMDTICNCCSCCCIFLRSFQMPEGVSRQFHQRSNYEVEVNHDTCIACGKCETRCPIDAIKLVDRPDAPPPEPGKKHKPKDLKTVSYNSEICIGCGVCVHKCPTQSISMVRRPEAEDFPGSFMEAGRRMLEERGKDLSKIF